MKAPLPQSQEKLLKLASGLGLAGLATALLYVFHSTPYSMVLFMLGGISMMGLGILILAWAIVREIRSRLETMSDRRFAAGEVICKQGDAADFMYVITQGEVAFVAEEEGKQAIEIGQLGPSDYFGDMAILSGTPYQATARALGDVELLAIHRRDFRAMHAHLPNLRERVSREQERKRSLAEKALAQSP